MGVPKFFRYISERYPCLSELAREQSIPDFDNLYLDMNGIIHNCSHPDDTNIHFNITEENMFKDIFNYIDKLFFLIKPQKLFFMAVDGVAPRAKMNQQRSRRFRSAKEAELLEQKAQCRGEVREHERFDSNCITPGTEFMSRLHEALQYFIKSKVSTDPLWQNCRVILSGHNSPGEGEHKIMDYIRYLKSQKDYNPNTRHCLYGLDADLIILGLCTHELHFVVLREEVKFGRKTKNASVEETRFFLLHLGLLREYLEMEFDELRKTDESFDIAKLIDDWVLMGFLVGNDFIPHLPCLHISSNALPLLYKTYIKVYPKLGGNINVNGKLNLERLEKYFAALSEVEFEIFQENYADLKYFDTKQTKNGIDEAFDFDISEINNETTDNDLADLIESSRQFLEDDDEDLSDNEQHINDEFETYKRNYYMNKLNQNDMSSALKREQAVCYITALQWILDYYYRGVQSWDWYYPHHYAPFISDLKNFKDYEIKLNMGKPFLPFEQLLAVLPAASKELLPTAYRELMTSADSALINFYPNDFETDLNGKKHEWEAVVLIPFIDEDVLLRAMKTCESKLTTSEVERNQHGPMLQYDYNNQSQGNAPGIYSMKALYHVFCTEKTIWANEIAVPADKTVCIELPNAARTVFFPGFPTMKHLKYDFELRVARVKVFDRPGRNENLLLKPLARPGLNEIFTVAEKYLNQVVFIGWPHLIKAKVVAVSNKEKLINVDGIRDMEPRIFQLHVKAAEEHLSTRMGIEFNDLSVMVHVRTHIGSTYVCNSQGKITVNDAWSPAETAYPAQGVVAEIAVHNSLSLQHKKVEHLFPTNSTIFFVGNPYYGSEGTVLNPLLVYECGRLKVNITVLPEPNFSEAKYLQSHLEKDYINSYQAAATLGLQSKCLGRVTGTVLVIAGARRGQLPDNIGKTNIGLQFKFPKQQEERSGYARRINNQWYYSSKAIALIQLYHETYPVVFDYLSRASERSEFCFEEDLFPTSVGDGCVEKIVAWLKTQEHANAEKIACGSKTMELEAVEKILESIEQLKSLPVKTVKLQVKPYLLLKPDVTLPEMYKPKRPVKLFDRVVVVKTTYMVPLGAKGTVVGIYPVSDPNPVRLECVRNVDNFFEVLFDKHLPNGNDIHGIAHERVYKIPESSVLLIFTQDNKLPEMHEALKTSDSSIVNCTATSTNNNAQTQAAALPAPVVANDNRVRSTFFEPSQAAKKTQPVNPAANVAQTPAMHAKKAANDAFWMPSTNAKKYMAKPAYPSASQQSYQSNMATPSQQHKPQQPIMIMQKPPAAAVMPALQPKPQQMPPMQRPIMPQEYQAETMVLKNWLGLSAVANIAAANNAAVNVAVPQDQFKVSREADLFSEPEEEQAKLHTKLGPSELLEMCEYFRKLFLNVDGVLSINALTPSVRDVLNGNLVFYAQKLSGEKQENYKVTKSKEKVAFARKLSENLVSLRKVAKTKSKPVLESFKENVDKEIELSKKQIKPRKRELKASQDATTLIEKMSDITLDVAGTSKSSENKIMKEVKTVPELEPELTEEFVDPVEIIAKAKLLPMELDDRVVDKDASKGDELLAGLKPRALGVGESSNSKSSENEIMQEVKTMPELELELTEEFVDPVEIIAKAKVLSMKLDGGAVDKEASKGAELLAALQIRTLGVGESFNSKSSGNEIMEEMKTMPELEPKLTEEFVDPVEIKAKTKILDGGAVDKEASKGAELLAALKPRALDVGETGVPFETAEEAEPLTLSGVKEENAVCKAEQMAQKKRLKQKRRRQRKFAEKSSQKTAEQPSGQMSGLLLTEPEKGATDKPGQVRKTETEITIAFADLSREGPLEGTHLRTFKASLLDALDSCEDVNNIGFVGSAKVERGLIVVRCKNQRSKEWLLKTVEHMTGLWEGAKLAFSVQKKILIVVHDNNVSNDIILTRLQKQNSCVKDISKWSVIRTKKFGEAEKTGVVLTVQCPKEDVEAIKIAGGKLIYGNEQAVVRFQKDAA